MHIVFRTDASIQIGTGHVVRDLTLANKLFSLGVRITFICREHPGNLCEFIEKAGYQLVRLATPSSDSVSNALVHSSWLGASQEEDALKTLERLDEIGGCDWLIVDHYAIDITWEKIVRQLAKKIMVIDDLADRSHDCDLLLDQNFYQGVDARYDKLVSSQCIKLLGPHYAMLRPEFSIALSKMKIRTGKLQRILVFFGATDSNNETLKVLHAFQLLNRPEITVHVILGINHPFKSDVRNFASSMKQVVCHDYVENMAELMIDSDLYLGAAGTTTWERCCLGLPSLVIAVASNQIGPIEQLSHAGIVRFLGEGGSVTAEYIARALNEVLATPSALAEMSRNSMRLVDGQGVQRCVSAILNYGEVNEETIQNYT